jgi:O-antigen ligase
MNQKALKIPFATIIGSLGFLSALAFGLFFTGTQNLFFAPALVSILILVLAAIMPQWKKTLVLPHSAPALCVLLLGVWFTISLVTTTVPFVSLITYLVLISMPLTFLAFTVAQPRMVWLLACLGGLWLVTLAVSITALWQAFTINIPYYRAAGPFLNPNSLAAFVNISALTFMPLIFGQHFPRIVRVAGLWAVFIIFAAVCATASRAGLAAFVIATLVYIAITRPDWRKIIILVAGLIAVFTIMHFTVHNGMVQRIVEINNAELGFNSLPQRGATIHGALSLISSYPFLGTGLGTFYLYYAPLRDPLVDNASGMWVHYDALQIASETGIIGGVLIYALFIAVLMRMIRSLRVRNIAEPQFIMVAGSFCALLTVAIDSHISFPLYQLPLLIASGFLLAFWHEITTQIIEPKKATMTLKFSKRQKLFGQFLFFMMIMMMAAMVIKSAIGIYYTNKAQIELSQGKFDRFTMYNHYASQWAPPSYVEPYVQLAGFNIDMLTPPAGLILPHEQVQLLNLTNEMLDYAQKMHPLWAEIDYKRGRLWDVTGAYELTSDGALKAAHAYQKALQKNPTLLRAREHLARIYVSQGRPALAYELLEEGLKYPPIEAAMPSYYNLMKIIKPLAQAQEKHKPAQTPQTKKN